MAGVSFVLFVRTPKKSSPSVELSSCWIGNVVESSVVSWWSISSDSLIDRIGPWGRLLDDESIIAGVELFSLLSIKWSDVIDFRGRRLLSSGIIDSDCKSLIKLFLSFWIYSLSKSSLPWLVTLLESLIIFVIISFGLGSGCSDSSYG